MFRSTARSTDNLDDLERVEASVRERFSLATDDIVLVSENPTTLPGAPPLETEIAIWTDTETRYRFKVFKPVGEVAEADLPVSWLMPSLRDYGDADCC